MFPELVDQPVARPESTDGIALRRVDALDGLRGWLALCVAFAHATGVLYPALDGHGPNHFRIETFLRRTPVSTFLAADFAVRIFFVHSGFVMALKYMRSRDWRWPLAMLIRRPVRLGLPILGATYVAFLLLAVFPMRMAAVAAISGTDVPVPRFTVTPGTAASDGFFGNLLFARSRLPGAWWTMPVELYCSVALLIVLVFWCKIPRRLAGPLTCAYLVFVAVWATNRQSAPSIDFSTLADSAALMLLLSSAFVLGAIVANSWVDHPDWFRSIGRGRVFWLTAGAGALALGTFPRLLVPILGDRALLQLAVIVAAATALCVVLASPPLRSLFERPASRWLGRLSFAVYLLHVAVQRTVMDNSFLWLYQRSVPYNLASLTAISVCTAATLALAHVFARSVDRVALSFGKRRVHEALGLHGQRSPTIP